MNKNGFTIVELLAAIAILSLLMGIAAFSYTSIVNASKKRAFEAYESTMKAQAMQILVESITDPTKSSKITANNSSIKLKLSDLEMDPFVNPVNKDDLCPDSYVLVTRNDVDSSGAHVDAFEYEVCLICENSDYKTNDTCHK